MVKNTYWYFLEIVLILLTVLLQYSAKYQLLPLTNHLIPDSFHYETRVFFDLVGNSFFSDGLTYYHRFLYNIGPASFLVVNSTMLILSIYFCTIFSRISPQSVSAARFIIVFNPYLLIGAVGPNKETLVIFLSLATFYFLFQTHKILNAFGICVATLVLFVRPVAGIILISSLLMSILLLLFKNPLKIFLSLLLLYFILNAIPPINDLILSAQGEGEDLPHFQGSNILEVAIFLKIMNQSPILQIPALFIKAGLILITPIFRPNPFYSIPFAILDVGYSLLAYALLPFNIGLLLLFFNLKRVSTKFINIDVQLLLLYCLLGIFATLLSSNISFRYIFPYAPFIFAFFYLHDIKYRNKIITYSFFLVLLVFALTSIFTRKQFELDTGTFIAPQFISWM
jgi:hypothetical protein